MRLFRASWLLSRWPAWAMECQLQTNATLAAADRVAVSNQPALDGYDNVVTNSLADRDLYCQLEK